MRSIFITIMMVALLSSAAYADLHDDYLSANQDKQTTTQLLVDEGLIPQGYVDKEDVQDDKDLADAGRFVKDEAEKLYNYKMAEKKFEDYKYNTTPEVVPMPQKKPVKHVLAANHYISL